MIQTPVLRPLTTGQLLDRAVNLYRHHFLTFIGIVAAVQIPTALLQFGANWLNIQNMNAINNSSSLERVSAIFPALGLTILLGIMSAIIGQLGVAAMAVAIANHYLGGKTGIVEAYKQVGQSAKQLFLLFLLAVVSGVAIYLWILVPCAGWFTGLGIAIFYLWVVIPLAVLILVLEKQSAQGAIRRAWSLGRRRFWYLLGYVLVLTLLSWVIVIGPVLLLAGLFGDLFVTVGGTEFNWVSQMIQSVLMLLLGIFYIPLQTSAMVLVYFDLRVRTEGFDLALQAEGGELKEASAAWKLLHNAPAAETGNWFTSEDWQRFVIVTLVLIGLVVMLVSVLTALVGLLGLMAGGV